MAAQSEVIGRKPEVLQKNQSRCKKLTLFYFWSDRFETIRTWSPNQLLQVHCYHWTPTEHHNVLFTRGQHQRMAITPGPSLITGVLLTVLRYEDGLFRGRLPYWMQKYLEPIKKANKGKHIVNLSKFWEPLKKILLGPLHHVLRIC